MRQDLVTQTDYHAGHQKALDTFCDAAAVDSNNLSKQQDVVRGRERGKRPVTRKPMGKAKSDHPRPTSNAQIKQVIHASSGFTPQG